jgi:hypothetical protein
LTTERIRSSIPDDSYEASGTEAIARLTGRESIASIEEKAIGVGPKWPVKLAFVLADFDAQDGHRMRATSSAGGLHQSSPFIDSTGGFERPNSNQLLNINSLRRRPIAWLQRKANDPIMR